RIRNVCARRKRTSTKSRTFVPPPQKSRVVPASFPLGGIDKSFFDNALNARRRGSLGLTIARQRAGLSRTIYVKKADCLSYMQEAANRAVTSAAHPSGLQALPSATLVKTSIEPAKSWVHINLRELWQARELLYNLISRDIKVRYKQTALGVTW